MRALCSTGLACAQRAMSDSPAMKRKASFEPGSAPPKKMALLSSTAPETPSAQAAVSTAPTRARPCPAVTRAALAMAWQTPTAHSAMNATVLQRQNQSLQTNLEQKRRDLDELKQKVRGPGLCPGSGPQSRRPSLVLMRSAPTAADQLERTEKLLLNKENALSVLDRHWEQMETQAAALLARVQAGAPPRPAHDTIQNAHGGGGAGAGILPHADIAGRVGSQEGAGMRHSGGGPGPRAAPPLELVPVRAGRRRECRGLRHRAGRAARTALRPHASLVGHLAEGAVRPA